MKKVSIIFISFFILTGVVMAQQKDLYGFKVNNIDKKEFDLSSLKGKKVMIVNVASRCGLTPQYAQLEELYQKYKDRNFVIIAFPSNDFKGQEPGTNEEIKEFCSRNYGVTFPIMDKVTVIGENKAPIYKWLTEKSENGTLDAEVQWNFQKFLIDENGNLVTYIEPRESPMSQTIIDWIEK